MNFHQPGVVFYPAGVPGTCSQIIVYMCNAEIVWMDSNANAVPRPREVVIWGGITVTKLYPYRA